LVLAARASFYGEALRTAPKAGVAKLGFKAHPHMRRHACGYALANKGHDTRAILGLRAIREATAPQAVAKA
jgi:integrase